MKTTLKIMKYHLKDAYIPILGFYMVILVLSVLFSAEVASNTSNSSGFRGYESATVIFLFIAGLNCFKNNYKFMQANGITRNRFFISTIPALFTIAVFMAVVDTMLKQVSSIFSPYGTMYQWLYNNNNIISGFIWLVSLYTAAVIFGWFVTLLYYRSGKALKLAISLSPAFIGILFGYLNKLIGGLFVEKVGKFVTLILGLQHWNPYIAVCSFLVDILILCGLIYLLIRRAPVKS